MISQKTLETASLLLQIHAATNKPKPVQHKINPVKQPVKVTSNWRQIYHWLVPEIPMHYNQISK